MSPAIPVLAELLSHGDADVLTFTCFAIFSLSYDTNEKIQAIIDVGICPKLVKLLMWVIKNSFQ